MDVRLIEEFQRYLLKGRDNNESPQEFIESCIESWSGRFFVRQDIIDANPRFLELINCSEKITRLEIEKVYGDELSKVMPFERLGNIEEIKFFGSNINGFFKHSSFMSALKYIYKRGL